MGQKVQGTEDLYGGYMRAWQHMQDVARELFGAYGFDMIETPAIEQVDTFVHGIGESTDVVRKEMFRVVSGALFGDLLEKGTEAGLKPRQRMAMRPEGTAGVVRAAVENNFVPQGGAPAKLWYAEAMFRGERPQKGRLRQFHQVGVEWLGAPDAAADAECIIMLMEYFKRLGFDSSKLKLYINSMGDGACRPAYREKVRQFILDHKDEMCEDCLERAEINPLRAFDCKNPHCHEVMAEAPLVNDHLCDDCAEHYAAVKKYLDEAGISYIEDPTLVRGLDYYTRTVFEVEVPGYRVRRGLRAHRARAGLPGRRPRDPRAHLRLRRRHGGRGARRRLCRHARAARRRHPHRGRLSGPQPEVPVQAGRQAPRDALRRARARRGRRGRRHHPRYGHPRAGPGPHGRPRRRGRRSPGVSPSKHTNRQRDPLPRRKGPLCKPLNQINQPFTIKFGSSGSFRFTLCDYIFGGLPYRHCIRNWRGVLN